MVLFYSHICFTHSKTYTHHNIIQYSYKLEEEIHETKMVVNYTNLKVLDVLKKTFLNRYNN